MKIMSEYDTTIFVNVDKEDFTGYYDKTKNPNGYTIKAGESRTLVRFIAETMAKHLVDKILQAQGVKDTMRDTPLRRDLFAKILPDIQQESKDMKVLSSEERIANLEKVVKQQNDQISALGGRVETPKKGGRPKKVEDTK